jgi:NAD-dependent deacetylase
VRYAPQDLATRAMFEREPETVWCWYLARFAAASGAQPNAAHRAVAELQAAYPERIAVVTQNVDALHHRAGSPGERTFAIHGDARVMRCARGCGDLVALPLVVVGRGAAANETVGDERHRLPAGTRSALTCASCSGWMRPHVLWFDEYYDELHYRSESALAAAERAELLVVVGTTGATTLPMVIANRCSLRGVPIIDVNVEATPFSALAERLGAVVREPASVAVPRIARRLASVS